MAAVPEDGYIVTDERGEIYLCNARCLCIWAVTLNQAGTERRAQDQKAGIEGAGRRGIGVRDDRRAGTMGQFPCARDGRAAVPVCEQLFAASRPLARALLMACGRRPDYTDVPDRFQQLPGPVVSQFETLHPAHSDACGRSALTKCFLLARTR